MHVYDIISNSAYFHQEHKKVHPLECVAQQVNQSSKKKSSKSPLVLTRTSLALGRGISKSSKVMGLLVSQNTAPLMQEGPLFTWYPDAAMVVPSELEYHLRRSEQLGEPSIREMQEKRTAAARRKALRNRRELRQNAMEDCDGQNLELAFPKEEIQSRNDHMLLIALHIYFNLFSIVKWELQQSMLILNQKSFFVYRRRAIYMQEIIYN